MYSFIKEGDKRDKKTKGINKDGQKNDNEEYIDVLFEKKRIRHEMKRNKMSHVY